MKPPPGHMNIVAVRRPRPLVTACLHASLARTLVAFPARGTADCRAICTQQGVPFDLGSAVGRRGGGVEMSTWRAGRSRNRRFTTQKKKLPACFYTTKTTSMFQLHQPFHRRHQHQNRHRWRLSKRMWPWPWPWVRWWSLSRPWLDLDADRPSIRVTEPRTPCHRRLYYLCH